MSGKSATTDGGGALAGVTVVELGSILAGPLAGTFLADFGADVIHVEKPGAGDPMRVAGPATAAGLHVWWKVTMRNKRSVTLNISDPRSHAVLFKLLRQADVVTENFRPGTLERWGLAPDKLLEINPRLVILRISGFGQRGPLSARPGFGKVGEAMSGQVTLTGFPDNPPTHVGFSLGDTTTGLMGALGVMMALYRQKMHGDEVGEVIDLALFETLFRLIEWQVPAYDQLGFVGERAGNRFPFGPAIVANTYQSSDGAWITISTATEQYVDNCVTLLGTEADEFRLHRGESGAADMLDAALRRWVAKRPKDQALQELADGSVVSFPIYTIEDILQDETYRIRENIVEVTDRDFGVLRQPAPIPHFRFRPGVVSREAPELGAHNDEVLRDQLQIDDATLSELRQSGLI